MGMEAMQVMTIQSGSGQARAGSKSRGRPQTVFLPAPGLWAAFPLPGPHSLHGIVGSGAGVWLGFCCYPVLGQLPHFSKL